MEIRIKLDSLLEELDGDLEAGLIQPIQEISPAKITIKGFGVQRGWVSIRELSLLALASASVRQRSEDCDSLHLPRVFGGFFSSHFHMATRTPSV